MTKANLFQWYNDLPLWARGVMIVGTGIVVVGGGYMAYKAYEANQAQKKALAETNGFISDLNKQTVKPSYQQTQYETWADGIATEFSGCDVSGASFGTFNEATDIDNATDSTNYSSSGAYVLAIVQQFKSDADFLALQVAWSGSTGSRTISKHWYCGGDDTNVTLTAAITDQLDTDEITALNTVLNSLGLTYTF